MNNMMKSLKPPIVLMITVLLSFGVGFAAAKAAGIPAMSLVIAAGGLTGIAGVILVYGRKR